MEKSCFGSRPEGREVVADDQGVDPAGQAECLELTERQLPAAGIAQDHTRKAEAQDRNPAQRFQRPHRPADGQRCARPGVEEIDRHLGRWPTPPTGRSAPSAARRSRPSQGARRSKAPFPPSAPLGRFAIAPPRYGWSRSAGSTNAPSRDCGCIGAPPRRPGAQPAQNRGFRRKRRR